MIENLKCPNCGGPLDTAKTEGNIAVCPWCGNKLLLSGLSTGKQDKKKDEEEDDDENFQLQYYRPQLTVEQFEAKCQYLFDNDPLLPDDIFREINFKEIKRVFLPTWVFRGKAKGSINWYEHDKFERRAVDEHFVFRTVANRTSSGFVPDDLIKASKAFELNFATDPETMWCDEFCEEYLPSVDFELDDTMSNLNNQHRLFRESMNDLYIRSANIGQSAKTIACNVEYKFDEEFDEVDDTEYVPFYIIGFNYKGQDYHLMSDAVNGSWFSYHLPEDKQRKKILEGVEFPNWAVILLMVIYIGPPLLWIFGPLKFTTLLWLAIPAFIIIPIICWIATEKAKEKKKAIIENAKKARKQ